MVSRNGKLGPVKSRRPIGSKRAAGTPADSSLQRAGFAGSLTGAYVGARGLNNLSADRQRRLLNEAIKHKFPAITRPAIFINETLTRIAGSNDHMDLSEGDAKVIMERIAHIFTSGAMGPELVPLGSVPYVVLYYMDQNPDFAREFTNALASVRDQEGNWRDVPNAIGYYGAQVISEALLNSYKNDFNRFIGALSGVDMSHPSTQRPIEFINTLPRVAPPQTANPGSLVQGGIVGATSGSVGHAVPGQAFTKAEGGGGGGGNLANGNCRWINGKYVCDGQF